MANGGGVFDAWLDRFKARQSGTGTVFDPTAPAQLGTLFQKRAGEAGKGQPGMDWQQRIAGLLSNPVLSQMMGGQGQPQLQGGGVHNWNPAQGLLYMLPQISSLSGLFGRLG